ncbi:hypothetical protein PS903_05178 [Pseudomonas fluorescens]|nr:hypothetical protein PS903_05178 [Pseudomonas fluorescens]
MTQTLFDANSREALNETLREGIPLTPGAHGCKVIQEKWGAGLDPQTAQLVTLDYDYHGHPPINGVHQGKIRFQQSLVQALLSDYQAVADDRFGETAFGFYTPPRVGPAVRIVDNVDEFAYQGSGNHNDYEGIYRQTGPQAYGPETQIDITPADFKKWVWQLDYKDRYSDYLAEALPSDDTLKAAAPYALRTSVKTAFVMVAFLQKRESSLSLAGLQLALSAAGLGEGQIDFGFVNNAQLEQSTRPMAHVEVSRLMIYRYTARDIWVFRHRTSGLLLVYVPGNSSPLHEFSDFKALRAWVVQQGKVPAQKSALAKHFAKEDREDGTYHAGVLTALTGMNEYPKMHRLGREAGFFNNDGFWNPDDYISLDTVPNTTDPFVELVKVIKQACLDTAEEAIRDDADVNRANLSAVVEPVSGWISRWGALAIFFPGSEGLLALAGLIEAGYGLNDIDSADTHAQQTEGLTRTVFGLLNALPLFLKAGAGLAGDADGAGSAIQPLADGETVLTPEPGTTPEPLPVEPIHPAPGIAFQPPGTEGLALTEWTRPQLMRGFGDGVEGLSDEALEQARRVSGVSDDHLRFLHAEGLPPQGILADTILRFKLDKEVDLLLSRKTSAIVRGERAELFKTHYLKATKADSELLENLSHQYPSLPKAVLEEMLARENLSPHSELTLGQIKTLYQRLDPQIQSYEDSLRLTRAYEGLFLDSVRNVDSDTLLLHSIRRMPGWPAEVSVVVRDGSPNGAVLDRIGATTLPEQRLVVKIGDQFQAYGPQHQPGYFSDDFADVLLHTLAQDDLSAMNLRVDQGLDHFKFKVRRNLLRRPELSSALQRQTLRSGYFEPEDGGLQGGAGPAPIGQAEMIATSSRMQVKAYFPDSTNQQADDFIARFGELGDAERELKRIQSKFPELDDNLSRWEAVDAEDVSDAFEIGDVDLDEEEEFDPEIKEWLAEERERRPVIGARLRRLFKWQGEESEKVYENGKLVGFELELDGGERQPYPYVSPRMESVVSLVVSGDTQGLDSVLENFSHVEKLQVQIGELQQLPNSLDDMTALRHLDMSECQITLTPPDVDRLARLTRLKTLNLRHNPLTIPPDVGDMTELRSLDLSDTDLSEFPAGVSPQIPSHHLILQNNQIPTIPSSVVLREGIDLDNNPISDPDSLRRLIAYRRRTGIDLWLNNGWQTQPDVWLVDLPPAQAASKTALWNRLANEPDTAIFAKRFKDLPKAPDFLLGREFNAESGAERLRRRVWSLLEKVANADEVHRAHLCRLAQLDPKGSAGALLEKLEHETLMYDAWRRRQPMYQLPKRPRLE